MAKITVPIVVKKIDHYLCGHCKQRIPSPNIKIKRGKIVEEYPVYCPHCGIEFLWGGVEVEKPKYN